MGPCECGGEGVTQEQESGGKSDGGVVGDSCNIVMIAGGCLSSVIATVVGQATWGRLTESSWIAARTG